MSTPPTALPFKTAAEHQIVQSYSDPKNALVALQQNYLDLSQYLAKVSAMVQDQVEREKMFLAAQLVLAGAAGASAEIEGLKQLTQSMWHTIASQRETIETQRLALGLLQGQGAGAATAVEQAATQVKNTAARKRQSKAKQACRNGPDCPFLIAETCNRHHSAEDKAVASRKAEDPAIKTAASDHIIKVRAEATARAAARAAQVQLGH